MSRKPRTRLPAGPAARKVLTAFWAVFFALTGADESAAAEFYTLDGHGGPVMAIDVSPDGQAVLTASFDYSVGLWHNRKPVWLEGHDAAANSVVFVDDRRAASGGDDFAILVWDLRTHEARRLRGHEGKIASLAVSPDRSRLASASWDGSIGLWDLNGDAPPRFLTGHTANVNAVAFTRDGRRLYSASADGTILQWDLASGRATHVVLRHGFGVNTLVLNEDERWLAYGAVDGGTRFVDLDTNAVLADLTLDRRPILAMDYSPRRRQLAVGDGHGYIMIVDTRTFEIAFDFRAARRGPVWALKYTARGDNILAGGLDDRVFSWPVETRRAKVQMAAAEPGFLRDAGTMSNGERQFSRKCSVCHSLSPGSNRRAGPTLYGLFGRPAGTVEGYPYSKAMRLSPIVWSRETINALFQLGPEHFAPGSKMPMQRIARQQDRDDLIAFLREATASRSPE
ncbi:MAG: c-type cytochrome [Paracoccaceae bacterium]